MQLHNQNQDNDITTHMLGISSVRDAVVLLQPLGSGEGDEPDLETLKEIVADLIAVYSGQEVQNLLCKSTDFRREAELRGDKVTDEAIMQQLRDALFPHQVQVVERYGFSGSAKGLMRVQNAVQRYITEGDIVLRHLANEALALLGFQPLESVVQEIGAEEFLGMVLQQGGDSSFVDAEEVLDDSNIQCAESSQQVLKEARKILAQLRDARRPLVQMNFGLLRTWAAWEKMSVPESAMIRLSTPPPIGRVSRPSARVVFEHVMRNQPLVIENGVDEVGFPPLETFQDFEYLRNRCGHRYVKVKGDSCWDKDGRKIFVNDPAIELPFSEYLRHIEMAESVAGTTPFYMGKVQLQETCPELAEDVASAKAAPMKKFGGCFGGNAKGMHTYFGAGGNTTSIHCDPSENLLVVISGSKTFQLFPPWDADFLYPTMKKCLNSSVPPFTDPSAMLPEVEEMYPLFRHAQPQVVTLHAGEMLYLPIFWWHAVQGSESRNMILNWWCSIHPHKLQPWNPETEGAAALMECLRELNEMGALKPEIAAKLGATPGPAATAAAVKLSV